MTREQKLEEALRLVRSMIFVERTAPAAHDFEKSKRAKAWGKIDETINAALSAPKAEAEEPCPVCAKPFAEGDTCATDIELGKCHSECLAGSPTVDLETGEPMDGPIDTFPHVAPKAEAVTVNGDSHGSKGSVE